MYNINENVLVYPNELKLVLEELSIISDYNTKKQTIATEIQEKFSELRSKPISHPTENTIKLKINLVIMSENEGIEIGRYDMLSNVIRIWRIARLLPISVIKYIIFHELMHVLIFDHNEPFYTILNQYPKRLEIERYFGVFQKYLKRQHIIKHKENYYFRIKKELSGIFIGDEKFLQCKYILLNIPFLR